MANNSIKKLAKKIVGVSDVIQNKKLKSYDTSGVVRRIEGNTAYIHFPGGIDETPVEKTINAYPGDTVQIRVSGGKAFLVGNATAPPTDDRVANVARRVANTAADTAVKAEEKAVEAEVYSESAMSSAESAVAYSTEAKQIAGKTNQYFWHKESVDPGSEDETGAHITEVPQEEWEVSHSGGNLLARSNGIAVRDGLTELASFGAAMRIGRKNSTHFDVGNTGINAVDENGNTYFEVNYDPDSSSIGQSLVSRYEYTIPSIEITYSTPFSKTVKKTLNGIVNNSSIVFDHSKTYITKSGTDLSTWSVGGTVNCTASALRKQLAIVNDGFSFTEGISDSYHYGATFIEPNLQRHFCVDFDIVYDAFTDKVTSTFTASVLNGQLTFTSGVACIFPDCEFTAAVLDTKMRLGTTFLIDSSGNMNISGAYRGASEAITPSITASKGTLVSTQARRFGQVVQLWIQYRNTSSIASGANVFEGTLNTTDIRPAMSSSGVGYYGAHAMVGYITAAGAITIRNASSSAVSISSTSTSSVSLTYLVN